MKKASVLIVSAVISLSMLCACTESELSSSDKSSSTTTKETTTTTAETTTTTTTTTEETTTTTTEQTTTTTTSQTEAVATGKATGERPNIKLNANYYMYRDLTQAGAPEEYRIGYDLHGDETLMITEMASGNDFMGSLDKMFGSNGNWQRRPDKDNGSTLAYQFTGTAKDIVEQEFTFKILIIVPEDNSYFFGVFAQDSKTMDDFTAYRYIFTNVHDQFKT